MSEAKLSPAAGSALGSLPDDWTCKACHKPAWQYACVVSITDEQVDLSDRDTIEVYGPGADMFTDGEEIQVCGYCGCARWESPNR